MWTLRPFSDNYLFRNFVFSPSDVNNAGQLTTGVTCGMPFYDGLMLDYPPTYLFQVPATNWTTVPGLLSSAKTQWLGSFPACYPYPIQ